MHCSCRGLVVHEDHERFDLELALQFSTDEDTDPPRMKLGLSSSSGPRAPALSKVEGQALAVRKSMSTCFLLVARSNEVEPICLL